MRTALFLLVGVLLLASFLLLGKLFSTHYPSAPRIATVAFIVVWLVVAAANMWVGVSKAGYSASEEAPIALLIFALPAIIAVLLKWRSL
jgi:hypothetical protein